jgi:FkbM family methyltransferase
VPSNNSTHQVSEAEKPVSRKGGRLSTVAAALRRSASISFVEPEILGLSQLVRPGDVCFDIGAAYGMYSYPLADLVGRSGAVHSFEPQRKPHRLLAIGRRLAGADHIRLSRGALGREPGTRQLTLPVRFGVPVHGHAHLRDGLQEQPKSTRFSTMRSVATPVNTVDGICDQRSIGRVHFMKIDVEGFEPVVLEGAQRTIAQYKPTLLLEIEDRHLTRYGTTSDEVTRSLFDLGYTMYTWRNGAWVKTTRVTTETRNYMFATEEAWQRPAESIDS